MTFDEFCVLMQSVDVHRKVMHRAADKAALRANTVHTMCCTALALCEVNGELWQGQYENAKREVVAVRAWLDRAEAFVEACDDEAKINDE